MLADTLKSHTRPAHFGLLIASCDSNITASLYSSTAGGENFEGNSSVES